MFDAEPVENLIQEARADQKVLGRLLDRYRPFLKVVAERHLNARLAVRCSASDVVQETLTKAFERFEQFRGTTEPEFSAWIKQIHDHQIDDVTRRNLHARKRSIDQEVRLEPPDGSATLFWREPAVQQSSPSQHVIRGEKALRLAALLETLPEAQREAVRYRHLEGWPIDEIAAELERSVAATAGLIKRGLQELRRKMHEDSWT